MKNWFYILFLPVVLLACKQHNVPEKKWPEIKEAERLVTDSSWGPVTATTDFKTLKKIFPPATIKDKKICAPPYCEDSITTTEVWDHHRFRIFWKEGQFHDRIAYIRSYAGDYPYTTNDSGKTTHASPYITNNGINYSTTLTELLKKNGKKISFHPFFGDKSGYISSFNGGTLVNWPIQFSLAIESHKNLTREEYGILLSGELDTEMPLVRKIMDQIKVGEISLSFVKEDHSYRPAREFKVTTSKNNN